MTFLKKKIEVGRVVLCCLRFNDLKMVAFVVIMTQCR